MTKNKLISIIVPVYNTEKYIEKCLNSILEAKTPECEVLIINDGSKDNCEKIIKSFISKLPKEVKEDFKYIYKDNKGLADTKNVGIKEASGEFISVVDSDDWIDPGFYKYAIPYLRNYDIVIYDLYVVFEKPKANEFDYVARAFEDKYKNFKYQLLNGQMQGSSCNKIIKKSLYTLEFPVGKQYEDVAVTPFILMNTDKIKCLPYGMYYYLQRGNSIVNTNTLFSAYYKICNNIQDVLDSKDKMDKYKEIIDEYFIKRTIPNMELNYKEDKKSFLNNIEELASNAAGIISYNMH
ncbi:MAG: glycosyltransferase family 2 protein [Bacilli bacterium]|nr:glycosyltransferase family 2 protein [Bacilli bacterium]